MSGNRGYIEYTDGLKMSVTKGFKYDLSSGLSRTSDSCRDLFEVNSLHVESLIHKSNLKRIVLPEEIVDLVIGHNISVEEPVVLPWSLKTMRVCGDIPFANLDEFKHNNTVKFFLRDEDVNVSIVELW